MVKSTMCEDIPQRGMSEVLALNPTQGEEVLSVNVLNNSEDVDLLKEHLKKLSTDVELEDGADIDEHLTCQNESDDNSNSQKHHLVNDTSNNQGDNDLLSRKLDNGSEKADSLCISTETLIDHADSVANRAYNDHHLALNTPMQNGTASQAMVSESVFHANNNAVTMVTTTASSGLLISPSALTQDVPVQMGDDNKRMSTVLESLDLRLVYIPTTQQLVAEKKGDLAKPVMSTEIYKNSIKEIGDGDADQCTGVSGKTSDSVCSIDANHLNTQSEMAKTDSSSIHGVQILTPGNLDDSASLCETDVLIKVSEADQLTSDGSDFVCNFPRISTNDSLLRTFTDASSLSSISTGTDFSVSAASLDEGEGHCIDTGDGGFMEISLHTRNSFERSKNPSQDSGFEDKSTKPKRKGLGGFLSRGLFSRKSKDSGSDCEEGQPGWKLFGKVPPKVVPDKDPGQIKSEYQVKQREDQLVANRAKKDDIEVMSTTALILENRPMNLPTKDPEEIERHRREYESMVEAARKKEQKELKQKKKQKQQQLRQEDQLMAAAQTWTKEILPNWEHMKGTKKVRDLWWHGIPTNVRGKVWKLALGNDLNVTHELYEICVSRAADRIRQMDESPVSHGSPEASTEPASSKESSVELIRLDVSRTFPQLCIFQKGGPYHDLLHSLLGAYACYRPDVGYVQGMSFIAGVLLLNMEVADAFICFANLLNRPCQLAFFRVDEGLMKAYILTFEEFFTANMATLQQHFQKHGLTPDLYLYDWIFTLYTKSLPLDVACRVLDIFCRDGEEFLFQTALGILKLHEERLMNMDFIHLAQFLTKLPECEPYENLFRSIETISMVIDKKKFAHVLASKRDWVRDNT